MTITITLAQLIQYLIYVGASIGMIIAFTFLYIYITPIKEMRLIREGCVAASLSFGGALLGLSLTLASSIKNSDNLLTFMAWGAAAAIIQLLVYFANSTLIPNARVELEDNNIAVGALFFATSVTVGIVNAACLS